MISFKRHQRRNILVLIGLLLLISLVIVTLSMSKQYHKQTPQESSESPHSDEPKTDEPDRSASNMKLMTEATEKKDVTICDQISGGIDEKKGESRTLPDGAIADSFGHPAMTEMEAKAQCRKQVAEE